ncbi:neo-calmodulin-like isoform X2 [Mercenaria mercenaria]|uniref:neo-calmodulin-like isoform X2 n=1 Tax=Mercenaria mercenaria TaxID=6596 RepID=UPI001E1D37BA|nr:neo-calmodulin-like isoform X2 [Mercenaria mercenaria]
METPDELSVSVKKETNEDTLPVIENGAEDEDSSEESEDEDDERYSLTVEQKEKLDLKKDTYKAMRDVFRTLDEDGSGSLEVTELETAMKSMGVDCSQKDMDNLIKQMDADGNGSVDFFEFCGMVSEKMKVYDPEKELREAFAVFDINGDGKVSVDEIQSVVDSLGGKMSKEEIDSMLTEADENSDGYLDYEEFVKIWMGETSVDSDKNLDNNDSIQKDADKTEDLDTSKAKPGELTVPK